MITFAKVYVRSIVGTITIGLVIAYLGITETEVIVAMIGGILGLAMIDKGQSQDVS